MIIILLTHRQIVGVCEEQIYFFPDWKPVYENEKKISQTPQLYISAGTVRI
jgi:hypothetical protein